MRTVGREDEKCCGKANLLLLEAFSSHPPPLGSPVASVPTLLHTGTHHRTSLGYWNSLSTERSQGPTGELMTLASWAVSGRERMWTKATHSAMPKASPIKSEQSVYRLPNPLSGSKL